MKYAKKRFAGLWAAAFITIFEIMVVLLNRRRNVTWGLFWYDLRSGFADNQGYFCELTVCSVLLLIVILGLFQSGKYRIKLIWKIRVKQKMVRKLWGGGKFIALCSVLLTVWISSDIIIGTERFNTWEGSLLIGHSFVHVDDYNYTGSLEAFLENYERGYRTFEVDLEVTSDDEVVLRHDWDQPIQEGISSKSIPTLEEFLSVPIYGKYTPMSFKDLCEVVTRYPDIWIITDSKYTEKEDVEKQFKIMVETAQELGAEDVLDRLVIQIYNESMLEVLRNIYPFQSYIFTLYQRWDNSPEQFLEIARWCVNNRIDAITMNDWRATEEVLALADRYDIDVYVHTVNDSEDAKKLLDKGIRGIYTDSLELEKLEGKG